jgi:AraC-like DNA-binding protein
MFDKRPPDMLDNRHCHDTYEVLYVLDGEGKFLVEGTAYDIKPGTLMIIRPFEYHSMEINREHQYERYVLNFPASLLVDDAFALLKNFMNCEGGSGKLYSANELSQSILPLFERFEIAETLPTTERALYIKMLLSELIVFLSVSGGEQMVHTEGELGARVIRYLNENISRDVSLDSLAKRFFVSKYYLCRAFKKHNGISVHGYINQKRVMYAKQLIEAGETASGAAYKVGFGDYSAFYRAYVKIVGKAPTA